MSPRVDGVPIEPPNGSIRSKTQPWRDQRTISEDEALDTARRSGVRAEEHVEDVDVIVTSIPFISEGTLAAWLLPFTEYQMKRTYEWKDFVHKDYDAILIKIVPDGLKAEESVAALLAHELYELMRIQDYMKETPRVPATKLAELLSDKIAGNFHYKAWGYADEIVRGLRGRDS